MTMPTTVTRRHTGRFTLANGLRVTYRQNGVLPVTGLALVVGAGFRDDPVGGDGLAHLTEHVVLADAGAAQGLPGWSVSAATRTDLTYFYTMGPSDELRSALRVEAARLRPAPTTPSLLQRHRDTVLDEIVRNRELTPFGTFPAQDAAELLFDAYADAHDGYGSRSSVGGLAGEDCDAFRRRHYHPAGCVLAISGDVDPGDLRDAVEETFGDLPSCTTARRPGRPGPSPSGGRRTVVRPHAPLAGLAVAVGMPDPADTHTYCATVALTALLTEPPAGILGRALDSAGCDVAGVSACCGRMRVPFECTGPDALVVSALTRTDAGARRAERVVWSVLERVAGGDTAALPAALAAWSTRTRRELLMHETAAMRLGAFEHVTGDPGLLDEFPDLVGRTEPEAVAAAAARALDAPRAVVELGRGSGR